MNKEQFIKGLKYLGIAYNKEFTEEQATVWYDFFKNETYDNFRDAVKRIIPKKQFMPSIAELKQEITTISNPVLQLNADEEWDNVLKAVRKYGSYQEKEAMNSLKSYTRHIARQVGYRRICMSESIQWERKEFIDLFNMNKERDENTLMLSEPTMTLAELTRMAKLKSQEMLDHKETLLIGGEHGTN